MRLSPRALPVPIDQLRAIGCRVIEPGDADYDEARALAYADLDRRPAAIVRVAGTDDVVRVVAIARDSGTELAVRAGGHGAAGHATSEGGIVLDLRAMKGLDVDVAGRTLWADAGLTAGEVTAALAPHGLAVPFGDTPTVGIAGLTLGGGVGYLARKLGMTIDSLLAAEIVTADGEIVQASEDSHPELFWAIRGGGGNFGVVTRFRYRLHEVPEVYGGLLVLPGTPEVVAGVAAAVDAAPDELTAIPAVVAGPPLPFLPPDAKGKPVVMMPLAFAGNAEAGAAAVAALRSLATPLADFVRPMEYSALFEGGGEGPFGGRPSVVNETMFLDRIGPSEAEAIVERVAASDAPFRGVQFRVLGGAVSRVPADATAYAHRERRTFVTIASFYDGTAEDRGRRAAWVGGVAAAIDQGVPGAYVNFLAERGEAGVRAAYPGSTWERLAEVKRRYDPTNVFHRTQNVPPAED